MLVLGASAASGVKSWLRSMSHFVMLGFGVGGSVQYWAWGPFFMNTWFFFWVLCVFITPLFLFFPLPCILAFLPHAKTILGHWKQTFWITPSGVKIIRNSAALTCWQASDWPTWLWGLDYIAACWFGRLLTALQFCLRVLLCGRDYFVCFQIAVLKIFCTWSLGLSFWGFACVSQKRWALFFLLSTAQGGLDKQSAFNIVCPLTLLKYACINNKLLR